MEAPRLKEGDPVEKIGGDYTIRGVIVSRFTKLSGETRFVVEATAEGARGLLLIYREENLRLRTPKGAEI